MSEELIKKIDEIVKQNKEFTRDMNEKLNLIRGGLTKKTEGVDEAYDRGLQDMWEIMYAVSGDINKGGLTLDECRVIFGWSNMSGIVEHLTYSEIVNKYKEYKEKIDKVEEKESQTFKRGDIIQYDMGRGGIFEGIFLYEDVEAEEYWVISPASGIPQAISKNTFTLTKTGNHVEIDKNLRVIRKE